MSMPTNPSDDLSPRPRPGRAYWFWAVVGLAIPIFALHGWSITQGLFLDDHAHFKQLRAADWTLRDLVDACRLELVGDQIEMWWLPKTTLRFFRPVAFGVMKLEYTLSGWNPAAAHVVSLCLHVLVCVLVLRLLQRLGVGPLGAWLLAMFVALQPAHIATVQWIASQTELMVTALLLGALLCTVRFRGWSERTSPGGFGWGIAALVCYFFALGCRENAVAFPVIAVLIDLLYRRSTLRRAWWFYAAAGLMTVGYLFVRSAYLGGMALPPKPYVIPPGDPAFLRFVFDKACYYLLGEFMLVPCVPFGGIAFMRSVPMLFYGVTALIVGAMAVLVFWQRRRPIALLGVLCLFGFMAPVLPSFESPHHLYLPGVGAVLLTALVAVGPHATRRVLRKIGLLTGVLIATTFGTITFFSGLAMDTGNLVESQMAAEIAAAPTPLHDGQTLYVANQPLIVHYLPQLIEERTGARDLRVVTLNWAPRILNVNCASELTRVDDRTIEVRVRGDHLFAGTMGRLIEEANGATVEEMLATPLRTDDFTVELLKADELGVLGLRFRFHEPLTRPGVHLFWGSQTRWAAQIYPQRVAVGDTK